MIPFKTTHEQVFRIAAIMGEMDEVGLDRDFIVQASQLARDDQGVFDLMALWQEAKGNSDEQAEIIADIQDSLDDYADAPSEPVLKPYIRYDQLEGVAGQVMAEKSRLRQIVDKHGGVVAVAQKSGIPQPSLSRMLRSASIPRRSTLYKIANALGLSEAEIAMEWAR